MDAATVTVKGIEINLTKSVTTDRVFPFATGHSVSASTRCSCGTTMSYCARINQPGKMAVRGLFGMLNQHGPVHTVITSR